MMPSAPSACIAIACLRASPIVVAAMPATTGTRPAAAASVTSTTRRFCGQER